MYRFSFPTSRFKNFVDHLGSFQNKTWRAELAPTANVAPLIGAAVTPSTVPSEAESRSYDALVTQLPAITATVPVVRKRRVWSRVVAPSHFLFRVRNHWTGDESTSTFSCAYPRATRTHRYLLECLESGWRWTVHRVPASTAAARYFPSEYRLVLSYRRNNRVLDHDSDLLSEAGQRPRRSNAQPSLADAAINDAALKTGLLGFAQKSKIE